MRFFMSDLYKALRKISNYAANRPATKSSPATPPQPDNFPKELGRMMQEILHSAIGTSDIKTVLEDKRMTIYLITSSTKAIASAW